MKIRGFVALLALCVAAAAGAAGLSLDAAKQQGLVGEQHDGYLGVVVQSPAAEALARDVNGKRRAEYERIASANGISRADVEALAGQKAIERTAAGHYVRLPGESWRRK